MPHPNNRLHRLGRIYLIYLGLLPALATLAAFDYLPAPINQVFMFLIFLGGVGGVGVYLAAVASYISLPQSWLALLLMLVDGPLFIVLAMWRNARATLAGFIIEAFLVDGLALFLAILILALRSPLPTRGERIGSVWLMLTAVSVLLFLFRGYWQTAVWGNWPHVAWLLVGILQGMAANYLLFGRGEIRHDEDFRILYIALLVMVWVAALFWGYAQL